jgi:hypothetical protein
MSYFPFPVEVDAVPNFATCQAENECKTFKATHAHDQKTRSDIAIMIAALLDVYLGNPPKATRKAYRQICMNEQNTVFIYMFDWFFGKYGKMTTKDR